jgi:hypothetical protein
VSPPQGSTRNWNLMLRTSKSFTALNRDGWAKPTVILAAALVAVAVMFLLRPHRHSVTEGAPAEGEVVTTVGVETVPEHVSVANTKALRRSAAAPAVGAGPAVSIPAKQSTLVLPEATPATRQLVEALVKLDTTGGVLSTDQASAWRTNFAQLIAQGAAALPAIREFLDKQLDVEFGGAGKQMLGYSSARLAMIDALAQIGGPESAALMSGVLDTSADPKEIAVIARNLEQLDPGTHRQQFLDAARQTLAMAADGKLTDRDVGPLFELFKTYGDASLATELASNAKQWNYYSMFSLGQLPEGAGLPSLIQIVNGEGSMGYGVRVPALEMLAQAAGQSDIARAALIDQATRNTLTAYNWATLEPILAGDQVGFQDSAYDSSLLQSGEVRRTHISAGNQNFYTSPPMNGLTADQIQQQNALIDELLKVTTDPNGIQTLQRSRALLERRLSQVSSTGPGTPSN